MRDQIERLEHLCEGEIFEASADPVDVAAEIINKGMKHGSVKALQKAIAKLEANLKKVKQYNDGAKRAGAGDTTAPDLVEGYVVKCWDEIAEKSSVIARQIRTRLEIK